LLNILSLLAIDLAKDQKEKYGLVVDIICKATQKIGAFEI